MLDSTLTHENVIFSTAKPSYLHHASVSVNSVVVVKNSQIKKQISSVSRKLCLQFVRFQFNIKKSQII